MGTKTTNPFKWPYGRPKNAGNNVPEGVKPDISLINTGDFEGHRIDNKVYLTEKRRDGKRSPVFMIGYSCDFAVGTEFILTLGGDE